MRRRSGAMRFRWGGVGEGNSKEIIMEEKGKGWDRNHEGEIPEICKLYWEKKKNKGENVYSCPRSLCVEKKYAGV